MATITEDYVSFQTAELLKEKGMDKSCFKHYVQKNNNDGTSEAVTVCTLQMAMKWLREVHNLFIQVEYDPPTFSADIYKMNEVDEYGSAKHIPPTFANAKSYEEAVEEAVNCCLKNLV